MTCRSLGHVPEGSSTFDLVVATLGRVDELGRLLDSLEAQTYRSFRVLVVDQNPDRRLETVLSGRRLELVRVTSETGLARARNVALPLVDRGRGCLSRRRLPSTRRRSSSASRSDSTRRESSTASPSRRPTPRGAETPAGGTRPRF